MPLDAIFLTALTEELSDIITDKKIDKIQQPERDVIILTVRGAGLTKKLLISAGAGDARIHFTEHQFENPGSPPMFCMLLRKHITGARIKSVTQLPAERVLKLALDAPDNMGFITEKYLILEFIGRQSNIILTAGDEMIIDCLRRIGGDISDRRSVLPGLFYRPPPVQKNKTDPTLVTENEWEAALAGTTEKTPEKFLLASFSAMSPLICREITWRAYGRTDVDLSCVNDKGSALKSEFFALLEEVRTKRYTPCLLTDIENKPFDFSYTEIGQYEKTVIAVLRNSFSDMLDEYFTRSAQLRRVRQRASATSKLIINARDRLIRKLTLQREELIKTNERETLRECGDIITANLHLMKKGQSELAAPDFFADEDRIRIIRLDPLKSPQQNAAKYYKDYAKARNAEKILSELIKKGEEELLYLESVIVETELAEGERDILDIRRELTLTGYIKAQKQGKEKYAESAPMLFTSSTGLRISAGKNNLQNESLTFKKASRSDIWLHVRNSHGSHVIIECNKTTPDDISIQEAAAIAAYYSSARSGGKTAVDYTNVMFVKKIPGGKPGTVTYSNFKTIIALPDEDLIKRLKQN